MSVQSDISKFIFWAESCLANIACKYVVHAKYGTEKKETTSDKLLLLRCYIDTVKRYIAITDKDFIENGVMTLGCEQIVLSANNSLSLQSKDKKISVNPEDINCISEENLEKVCNKIRALCSDC